MARKNVETGEPRVKAAKADAKTLTRRNLGRAIGSLMPLVRNGYAGASDVLRLIMEAEQLLSKMQDVNPSTNGQP